MRCARNISHFSITFNLMKPADPQNNLIVCPICRTRFGISHRSQRSQKFCSRRCSNRRDRQLSALILRANRINIKASDPLDAGQQFITELTRRFPDLMGHLGGLGLALKHAVPMEDGGRRFAIAIPSLKILIDVDARQRRPSGYWDRAYRLARIEGWEILDDEQGMTVNAPLTQPGDAENTDVNLRTLNPVVAG
jgi:hypothetical protein